MKLSEMGKRLWQGAKTAAQFAPVALAVAGKNVPDGSGWFVDLGKGVHGILSSRDEREFEILLQKLESEPDMHGMRPRLMLTEFIRWHFKKSCIGEQVVSWWYGNDFRTFIVKLNNKEDPADRTALDFLKWMVRIIRSEDVRTRGFEKLVRQLEHVPHIPEGADGFIVKAQELARAAHQAYRNSKAGLIRHTRKAEQQVRLNEQKPRSLLGKMIRWI